MQVDGGKRSVDMSPKFVCDLPIFTFSFINSVINFSILNFSTWMELYIVYMF